MPSAIVLLHFDEPEGIAPSDAMGNLDDLAIEPGIVEPELVEAWTGRGRRFLQADTSGLIAPDVSGNGTMLPRDASIQALIKLELGTAIGPMTLIARGLNDGSTPERYAYGLEIEEQAANPGYVEARWFWQDGAGAIRTQPAGVFEHAGDGEEIMITATRRWEGSARVVVRYYIDKRMIAELVSVDGDISGGVTGTMAVGARKASGAWGRHFNGTIDELLVTDYELSADEVEQTWNRLTIHQPDGGAMFRGLAPPGNWWFANPSSDIARRAKVVSQALGLAIAGTEEIRATFLPDRCPAILIPRWEKLCGLTPKPFDSLDVRRARVVAHLSADEGYSIPALQQAFSGIFDLEADDVEILEYTNELREGFDTLEIERWSPGSIGTWSIVAGELTLNIPSGTPAPLFPVPIPCHQWTPLDHQKGRIWIGGKIANYAGLPSGAFVGMFLHGRIDNQTFWFGVYNDGVTIDLGYRSVIGLGSLGAFTSLATIAAGPIWLRINSTSDGTIVVSWSTSGPSSGFTEVTTSGPTERDLAGFGAFTTSTPGADIGAKFDDFISWCPESIAPFAWYAYRDPALAGTPDLIGAVKLSRKISPAHMYSSACASKSIIAGHEIYGQAGRGPCGGAL